MLLSLYLENYTLIEKQTIDFSEGFNVITGETGAGKSIIVGAISLIMGERASSDLIKSGKEKAILEATFDIRNQNIVGYENEELLIITRELSTNGRNISKINHRSVTQTQLKEVTKYLIDIHGQHQHQLLIDPLNHLEIIDQFLGDTLLEDTKVLFDKYQAIKKEYELLLQSKDLKQEEKDYLAFQLEELQQVSPQAGELSELKEQQQRLKNFTVISEAIQTIMQRSHDLKTIVQSNYAAIWGLSGKEARLETLTSLAENLKIYTEEFTTELADYESILEDDPTKLDEITERISAYNALKRKHVKRELSLDEDLGSILLTKQAELKSILENINFSETKLLEYQSKLELSKTAYLKSAESLSLKRKALAEFISVGIIKALGELKMVEVKFAIKFESTKPSAKGIDCAEFLISPNLGEPLKPMVKIASGGELSRIMLAIKSILLEKSLTGSMVFDEIDAGIGGDTANAIAQKIAAISTKHQVICVTHLAQIAAIANSHIMVSKNIVDQKTTVSINKLADQQRQTEVARMLSGKLTETTMAHAKELLKQV